MAVSSSVRLFRPVTRKIGDGAALSDLGMSVTGLMYRLWGRVRAGVHVHVCAHTRAVPGWLGSRLPHEQYRNPGEPRSTKTCSI